MKTIITTLSTLFALLMLMHEFDAIHVGEWRMFKFLRPLNERTQYLIFLYVHIVVCLVVFFYLWCSWQFTYFPIWALMNLIGVAHLFLHLVARSWKSNVFHSFSSFLFIAGVAATGMANLILSHYYLAQ